MLSAAHHQELNLIQQLAVVGVADLDEAVALRDLVHLLLDALQHLLVAAQLPLDVVHLPERLVQQLHQDVHLLLRRHDGLDVCLGGGETAGRISYQSGFSSVSRCGTVMLSIY